MQPTEPKSPSRKWINVLNLALNTVGLFGGIYRHGDITNALVTGWTFPAILALFALPLVARLGLTISLPLFGPVNFSLGKLFGSKDVTEPLFNSPGYSVFLVGALFLLFTI